MQPQGEVTNAKFRKSIRMLSQAVNNQVGQQRGNRKEEVETSRIHEFLVMNPPSFTCSRNTKDSENLVEELKKVFDAMHVIDVERGELAAYQLNNVSTTWFNCGRRAKMRMHYVRVGLALKKPSRAFLSSRT